MTHRINLNKANAKHTYVALLLEDGRKKALKKGFITEKDIEKVGPAFTHKEMKDYFSKLSYIKMLSIITKSSIGKMEMMTKSLFKKK